MKKRNIIILIAVLALGIFIHYGCTNKTSKSIGTKDLVTFSALSSANILSNTESVNLSLESSSSSLMKLSSTVDDIDMDKVNSYLQMMENMLVDDGPILISESVSDKEGYAKKLVFESKDLSGNKETYTLYFNETVLKEKDDDDLFELEEEFKLKGLAIIDGVEYKMTGSKEIEEDEEELELKITLDESNYVLIEQETETNESEYSYVVVKNGKKVLSMSFELEDGIEEIVIKSKESGSTEIYKFYKSKGDIVIKHIKNGLEVKIVVKSYQDSNNETIYEYKVTETNKTYKYSK